jgi:integral membrane protein (TIGR01906 family)
MGYVIIILLGETSMKFLINKTLSLILALNLFILTLFLALVPPALNTSFYHDQFVVNNSYERANTNPQSLNDLIDHTLDYTYGLIDNFQYTLTLVDGSTRLAFSQREIDHMLDVQNLFIGGRILTGISLLLFLLIGGYFLVSPKSFKREYFKIMRNTIVFILLAAALILGFAALDFNTAFTIFHQIFFTNDLWILSSTDMLIIMLPEALFFRLALRIFVGLIAYLTIIIGGLNYFANRKVKRT